MGATKKVMSEKNVNGTLAYFATFLLK